MDVYETIMFFIMSAVIGSFIASVALGYFTSIDIHALGDAICTEKYGMVFDKYADGILYCKSQESSSYDGIKVVLGEID